MVDRASVFQTVNVGVEVTSGTAAVCAKKLTSMSIEPAIKSDVNMFRPSGMKYATMSAQGQEWVEAKVSGLLTYSEIVYALSGILKPAVITTPATGVTARQWLFEPSSTLADAVKTFTVEQGDATYAHRFTFGLFDSLALKFDRKKVDLSGSMLGQALITSAVTMNPSPTTVPLVPVMPKHITVSMSDTQATLAAAPAMTRVVSGDWGLSGRFKPIWPLNAAQPSWDGYVEDAPKLTAKLLVEADSDGMDPLTHMRDGSTKWLRIKAVGDIIELALPYTFQIDMACKVSGVSDFKDQDGLFAVEWSFDGVSDGAWGKALAVTVQNTAATL